MTLDLREMHQHWMESSVMEVHGALALPPDWAHCEGLMLVRKTMVEVVKGKDALFRKPDRVRSGRRSIVPTKVGRSLQMCLGLDVWKICSSFPLHRFDPYFNLFSEIYVASPLWRSDFLWDDVDQLNAFVNKLRAAAKRTGFMENVANHERGTMKNAKTVRKYLNDLYCDYPKILHVRIDLYYKVSWPRHDAYPLSAEQMKADRAKFMRHVRKKFKDKAIGHMWTVEYGEMKGPHFHLLLHFNGQKVRQGITIAHQLGEHWRHIITNGIGRYWNVNKYEDGFEAQGRRGIGLISHADEKRRENLLRAALYLVKADLFVRLIMPGFGKTFGHGHFRPRKKSNAGRKRQGKGLFVAAEKIHMQRGGISRR